MTYTTTNNNEVLNRAETLAEVRQHYLQLLECAETDEDIMSANDYKEEALRLISNDVVSEYARDVTSQTELDIYEDSEVSLEEYDDYLRLSNDDNYLEFEEGIDVRTLYRVRETRRSLNNAKQQSVSSVEMDLALTNPEDEEDTDAGKRCVLKVYDNGDRLIANPEGNFIENAIQEVDRPDWLDEIEASKDKELFQRKMKYLNQHIRDSRIYKDKLMKAYQKTKVKDYLDRFHEQEHIFNVCSKAKDAIKRIDDIKALSKLLDKFVAFQQKAEGELLETLQRDALKSMYLDKGFNYARAVVNNKLSDAINQQVEAYEDRLDMLEALAY